MGNSSSISVSFTSPNMFSCLENEYVSLLDSYNDVSCPADIVNNNISLIANKCSLNSDNIIDFTNPNVDFTNPNVDKKCEENSVQSYKSNFAQSLYSNHDHSTFHCSMSNSCHLYSLYNSLQNSNQTRSHSDGVPHVLTDSLTEKSSSKVLTDPQMQNTNLTPHNWLTMIVLILVVFII